MKQRIFWAVLLVLLITGGFVWLMLEFSTNPNTADAKPPKSPNAPKGLQYALGFPGFKENVIARWETGGSPSFPPITVDPAGVRILARYILTPVENDKMPKAAGFEGAQLNGFGYIYQRPDQMIQVSEAVDNGSGGGRLMAGGGDRPDNKNPTSLASIMQALDYLQTNEKVRAGTYEARYLSTPPPNANRGGSISLRPVGNPPLAAIWLKSDDPKNDLFFPLVAFPPLEAKKLYSTAEMLKAYKQYPQTAASSKSGATSSQP